jgi:hypothetical protein
MRGADSYNGSLFTTVKLEDFVPAIHPSAPDPHLGQRRADQDGC